MNVENVWQSERQENRLNNIGNASSCFKEHYDV
jgi:hypothetical protein